MPGKDLKRNDQRESFSVKPEKLKTFMRVVLDDMPEDPDPIAPGSQGTFVDYDDAGDLMIDWDEDIKRGLHLVPTVDKYHVLNTDSESEMNRSWVNLAYIQSKLKDGLTSRCPRCGELFDCRRGAVSRRIQVTNVRICPTCGQKEAIEDFVTNGAAYGVEVNVAVPAGDNHTGYETEKADDEGKEKLKIDILPMADWYIAKVWTGQIADEIANEIADGAENAEL